MHPYIKASTSFSVGALLIACDIAFAIYGKPESGKLLLGVGLSTIIGIIIGIASVWGHTAFLRQRSLKLPVIVCCASAVVVVTLYFYFLSDLYHQGVFHLTLAIGIVSGCLFVSSYWHSRGGLANGR